MRTNKSNKSSRKSTKTSRKDKKDGKPTVFLRPGEELMTVKKGSKAPEKDQKKKSEKAPQHPPIPEGGEIVINEQVGVHFRTTPADAPKEGETVTINFGDNKVVLVAKAVSPTKDGNRLVQAFVQKGSGDYAKLAPNKGNKATWKRGGALPVKEKKAKANGKAGNGKCPACKHPPALCTCQRTE